MLASLNSGDPMPDVSGRALLMALQAVDAELRRFEEAVHAAGDHAEPDDEEMLLAYDRAQAELRETYSAALLNVTNLPSLAEIDARMRAAR